MRLSKLVAPIRKEKQKNTDSISHDLSIRAGLIQQVSAGIYDILPLGQKVISKIETIVRSEMDSTGAQEVTMPIVQISDLWKESGRWNVYGKEMLRFVNRENREFCLGPTHEEAVSNIAKLYLNSYKQLPFNLYQIGRKYRDEIRPRHGFLRSREFIMKDAYSFDIDKAGLDKSYALMKQAYINIFSKLGVNTYPIAADSGEIGGSSSEEFMMPASIGEDKIKIIGNNAFKAEENEEGITALEIGHIFKLGDKYSKSMGVTFINKQGIEQYAMMGCYGIGITRALSAIIEKNHDEKGIVWPQSVAPFKIIIIPLDNSDSILNAAENVYKNLLSNNIDTLIDDRSLSSGIKFNDANLMGIPHRIILGKREMTHGRLEIEERRTMNKYYCDINDVINTYNNIHNHK